MHPAVVTAVLLLVGTIITVTAQTNDALEKECEFVNPPLCEEGVSGWVKFDGMCKCMNYFRIPKTFQEAQDYCHSMDGELVSIHNNAEMLNVKCLSYYYGLSHDPRPYWIGAKRSGKGFEYTDGSAFDYTRWLPNQPDNYLGREDCVELNALRWGMWNDNLCSGKKDFVCVKNP